MEKEVDQIQNECRVSDEQYEKLIIHLEESRSREAALEMFVEDLKCEIEKKNVIIEDLKMQNERVLMEKNGVINRLENELNNICSDRVNFNVPDIKVEGPADYELPQDDGSLMVISTPANARRGRADKIASTVTLSLLSQDSIQKEVEESKSETGSLCGSTRSRRTLKTEFAALPSSTKTTTGKPRKPSKTDCEDVAHPAHLSAPPREEDPSLEPSTVKRKLFKPNAKCRETPLPSLTKEKADGSDGSDFPLGVTTRSRARNQSGIK